MASHLFKHGALQTTDDNAIVVFQGRNVGGSPTINNGICIRMHGDPLNHPDAPNPLAKWREIGAGLNEARFTQAYDAVQDYLRIRQIEPRSSRSNGPHLLRGWAQYAAAAHDQPWAQRAPAGWFHKNFGPADSPTPCSYCGYCNTGCPYGRKLGMAQTYLPDATANHGALILAETRVDRIEWAVGDGPQRRAIGVVVTDADGGEHVIQARKGVVVAAGTIASSLLLDRSGIEGTGQQISLNIASPVIALMPEGMSPAWDEDEMATMVDCGDFLFESHFQPPLSMASLMPGWFGDMDKRMRAYDRICSAGVLFPGDRRGQIVNGKLQFKLTQDDLEVLRRASATLTKVHFAGGALEVWPALLRGQTLTPDMDIDAFYEAAIQETDDVTVSSAHPHGGNPINADPALGVVDTQCRVHGTDNVLVTDASVFPSCIRVNAQFSTMAIAQYATGFVDPFG
jgi:choline dehydrogenase-like flavoprotein